MATVQDQYEHCLSFFSDGLRIIREKGKDYAPEDIAMIDVFYAAAETGQTPQGILWVYVRKHLTALRAWMRNGAVDSEPVRSRLLDVANYMAMIDFVNVHRARILRDIAAYNNDPASPLEQDQRDDMAAWLATHVYQMTEDNQ